MDDTMAEKRARTAHVFWPRIFLILASSFWSASGHAAEGTLKVFYCIYEDDQCVDASMPIEVELGQLRKLAELVLTSTKGNFIGFIDENDVTLQFYLDRPDRIHVEIPVPSRRGSYAATFDRRRSLEIIEHVSSPLARYERELRLEFESW